MAVPHSGVPSPSIPPADADVDDLTANTVTTPALTATIATVDAAQFKGEPWFDVKAYGATGDGVTDDSAAIQAASNAAGAAGGVFFPPGTYNTGTNTITVAGAIQAEGATLSYGGTGTAIRVRNGTGTARAERLALHLPQVVHSAPTALSGRAATLIGVEMVNVYTCDVYIPRVRGFGVGALFTAFGTGNVYNTVRLGHLDNNKVNLKLAPGDTTSWVNENLFLGGRLSMESGEGSNIVGARHILLDTATSLPNNNVFLRVSVEGDGPEFHVQCYGNYNVFEGLRWEATTPKADFAGTALGNAVVYGYAAQSIVFTEAAGSYRNHLISTDRVQLEGASGTDGLFVGANSSSSSSPVFATLPAGDGIAADSATRYGWRAGHSFTEVKRTADTGPRMRISHDSGKVEWGWGDGAYDTVLQHANYDRLELLDYFRVGSVASLPVASSAYRGYMIRVEGGAGVADVLYVCRKNASDAYEWVVAA